MKMNKTIAALLAVTALGMGGCASQATKNAQLISKTQDTLYGQVMRKKSMDSISGIMDKCADKKAPAGLAEPCKNPADYDVLWVATMYTNKIIGFRRIAPKAANIPEWSFVQFSPKNGAVNIDRLVAEEETSTCRWEGPSLRTMNSGVGSVAGFAAGLLIVPAVVMWTSDEVLSGGVICESWNYKTIWDQAKTQAATR